MSKVTIIGSGFIGRAWAITFARAGHQVVLWDSDSDAAGNGLVDAYMCGPLVIPNCPTGMLGQLCMP